MFPYGQGHQLPAGADGGQRWLQRGESGDEVIQ